MSTLPTVVTSAGLQPQTPAALRAQLLTSVAATNPGYTATLPGSLIEDVSSTIVGALVLIDSARVEAVNSLTPFGANDFTLAQLGAIYGPQPGTASNTSVSVSFSGPAGLVIPVGFTVTDGTYQYVVQDGGVIASGGQSQPLFCLATIPGTWTVATNTVTGLVTSPPPNISPPLTCSNLQPGTPGGDVETSEEYRARVLQAGMAFAQGLPTTTKTLVSEVSGVQVRLVSLKQVPGGGWIALVGGGDPYEVAFALFDSGVDISTLDGSTLSVVNITQANPGVVTTDLNHGYVSGQVAVMTEIVGMTPLNSVPVTVTVIDEKMFSIGVSTLGYPAYVSGGVVSPNLRNVTVNLNDYPDIYAITFVSPPQQTVLVDITWNTSSTNFVSSAAVAQLGNQPLVDYLNSIPAGAPINEFVMTSVFQEAIASVLAPALLTRVVFAVSINDVSTSPSSGTGLIAGDPQSYFFATTSSVVITQG